MDTPTTGFSDVDASGRSEELVDYLARLARITADLRREGYAFAGLQAGHAVLDVGCGAGEVCVEMSGLVGPTGRVAGVDLSAAMIDAAKAGAQAAGQAIDLRVASVYQLPFADGSFDVVRAERVFQHLDDPEAALREMMRVTRVGGQVLLIDPDHGQLTTALDSAAHRRVFEAARRAQLQRIVNPHSGVRLKPMMLRAGLRDVQYRTHVLDIPYAAFRHAVFLDELLAESVSSGAISADEARALTAELQARDQRGEFLGFAVGYSVLGMR